MIEAVKKILTDISENSPLVVSVSGGIDSMSLLDILRKLNKNIVVVNFNHQKRSQAILEKQMIEDYCMQYNIPFHYYVLDIKTNDFQNEARNKRISILNQVASKINSNYIVTAHHASDLLENILMKLVRGSNLFGYAGMHQRVYKDGFCYLKPLLYFSKESINEYAINNHIKYLEDESNQTDSYLRNRIRHNVVPLLISENPSILNRTVSYNKQLSRAFNYIRKQSLEYLGNDNTIKVSTFKKLDEAIKYDVVSLLLERFCHKNTDKIEAVMSLILNNHSSASFFLNKDTLLIKSYDIVYVTSSEAPKYQEYLIKLDSKVSINGLEFFLTEKEQQTFINLCYNYLVFPLVLRNRRAGDRLCFHYGTKKLKDYLIDKKIPLSVRNQLILLCDSNNTIIYIPDLYINKTLGNKNTLYLSIKKEK